MENVNKMKAIAIDLDGTLVGSTHHVSEENRKAVKKAAELGMHIIIASGRPLAGIRIIAEEIKLSSIGGFVVGANGACVVDMKTGDKIEDKTISEQLSQELICFVKKFCKVTILTYDEEAMIVEDMNHPYAKAIAKGLLIPMKRVEDLLQGIKSPANKFILTGKEADLSEMFHLLKNNFQGKLECIYGGDNFIEVMPCFVSKAEGLKLLMQKLHLSEENLMCIGDSANDIQMFEYAGLPVAMENACEEIKKRACYITSSCDDNGVAKAIRHFVIGE